MPEGEMLEHLWDELGPEVGKGRTQKPIDENEPGTHEEMEDALTYDSIFERVTEVSDIKNPKSYLRAAVWRRCYDLVRNGMATYDEVFHEAVVGMYLAIRGGQSHVEDIEIIRSISRHLEAYKREIIGKKQEIDVSSLEQEGMSGEEAADRLRFAIKIEAIKDETSSEVLEDDFTTDLLRQARSVIIEGESREGQGKRDWEVFTRYIIGDSLEDICANCDWLRSVDSVEKALERIIIKLRREFGADSRASITLFSEARRVREGNDQREFDRKQYYKEWYERNKEKRQLEMREYMKKRRSEE